MRKMCVRCGDWAAHKHHRKLRSQGGDDSDANLIPVCLMCHDWIHRNPAQAYEEGWMVKSWDDPATKQIQPPAAFGHEVVNMHTGELVGLLGPEPGAPCPTCHRRVPHEKKKDSPKSRTVSLRIPDDGIEEWDDLFVLIAERVGVSTKEKYFKYKALLYAMREALA